MKTVKMINVCEDNVLTGQEFYEQFKVYFIKKMKGIGATRIQEEPYLFSKFMFDRNNTINFSNNYEVMMKAVRKYGRELLGLLRSAGFSSFRLGESPWLGVCCDGEGLFNKNHAFLVMTCYVNEKKNCSVNLVVSLSDRVKFDILNNSDFVISKNVLKITCAKVDEIAKAIRLVPFGE